MASLFSETWLLICAVVAVQLAVTRSQFCASGWKYHDLTGSCMRLEQWKYKYLDARHYCESTYRGHLVFIFDKATDDFVKGLLGEGKVDSALIGLHDRTRNGVYFWGNGDEIPVSYMGWSDNPHKPDSNKHAVVITNDGWEEYDRNTGAYFVCQVNVDFPPPKILCPSAEEGQKSPNITCTVDSHPSFSVTGIRFYKATTLVATCDADSCSPSQGNLGYIAVSRSQTTGSTFSWNLGVINVRRSDDSVWTCSVQHSYSGAWVTSSPCSLKVYAKPTGIECSHKSAQATVEATCTVARVYTQLDCSWKVMYKSLQTAVQVTAPENVIFASGNTFYRATCQAKFKVMDAGRYDIAVFMFPTLPELNNVQTIHTARDFSVSVEPPKGSPELYIDERALQTSWLEVTENVTLRLTCRVPGGDPPVYRTIITCDQLPQKYESDGSSVTIDVSITRVFHGRKCTCSALHAAKYAQTSSVEIRVKYPATVTSFWISSPYGGRIRAGDILFTCTASGNPTPHLAIQRQDGTALTDPSTGYNLTHTEQVKCSDRGKYLCLANNTVNGQHYLDSRVARLQIRCAAEHCDGVSSLSLPAAIGSPPVAASFQICVRVYPAPTLYILYKGNNTSQSMATSKYQVSFSFRNEEVGLGDITVIIFRFSQEDTGDYTLYSEYTQHRLADLYSYVRFRAFAQGPPSCPTNFTVLKADPNSVTLSWTPGFDGGLRQTFTVFRVDLSSDTTASSSSSLTMLGTVEDQEKDPVYEVTRLLESTVYTFGLEVTNEKGSGNCSHLQVNVSTSASPTAFVFDNPVTLIVVPVIIVVVLAILVVVLVVVVVIRRRKGYLYTTLVKSADIVVSWSRETRGAAFNNSKGDRLYANAASKDGKKANKQEKPPRKTIKGTDQNPVYAEINKQNKKGKKKRNNENMHNDVSGVYQNVSIPNVVQTSAAADVDNVYANASLPNKGEGTPDKTSSRSVNEEGLVYVTVEINKNTTYPEVVPANKPVDKKPQPEEENVEYIAINCVPAAKQE